MAYIWNPKMMGSGMAACIPQKGKCPNNCEECFFQSGRGYLEPLETNTPNMPHVAVGKNLVIRVNDGNDSNYQKLLVLQATRRYPLKFFNTSIPNLNFPAPVVLTVNPGAMTDIDAHLICNPPPNLMFVRFRTNTWNLDLAKSVVSFYSDRGVPIVLTFMAYANLPQPKACGDYQWRKRTMNTYYAISYESWKEIMHQHRNNLSVYSCSGPDVALCRHCGNCLREYWATRERMWRSVNHLGQPFKEQ